ncbi:MASE1 domain-containing protein [Enterobacter chuandaensis]|uniref:MASE1 domain-containing protein n=1 Tax=Enterobacter chuandaensis TaxID=2497875 RepID=UPI001C2E27BA|nr:MASE1 domain-containing protein [Enterobacter chuandaensis]
MQQWRQSLIHWIGFSLLYFILAMFCLETRDAWSLASVVWLPSGLVLLALCHYPRSYWPILGVSSTLLHIVTSLLYGRSLDIALVFALVDLAILFPLAMLWGHVTYDFMNEAFHSGVLLSLIAIFLASIVGGVACVYILAIIGYPVILSHFFTWSLSNATGCMVGAAFFILHQYFRASLRATTWRQFALVLFVSIIFILPAEQLNLLLLKQTLIYASLGGTLMLSVSLPLRALAIYFLYLTVLVNLSTLLDYGPVAGNATQDVQLSQLYLLFSLSLGLILAAQNKEILVHKEKLQQQLDLLGNMLQKRQPVFFQVSGNGKACHWSTSHTVFGIPSTQLPTLLLLQARIHPKDQANFTLLLTKKPSTPTIFQQCTIHLLLPDNQYHTVHCNILSGHPFFGCLGVLILDDEIKEEALCKSEL